MFRIVNMAITQCPNTGSGYPLQFRPICLIGSNFLLLGTDVACYVSTTAYIHGTGFPFLSLTHCKGLFFLLIILLSCLVMLALCWEIKKG